MKKYSIISFFATLLVAVAIFALQYPPCPLAADECSSLYRRYAHVPGIEAAYVKDYRINDTLTVDATLLHATDSATWTMLWEDFDIPYPIRKPNTTPEKKSIVFRFNKKGHTARDMNTEFLYNDFMAASRQDQTITILHITNKSQAEACIDFMTNTAF